MSFLLAVSTSSAAPAIDAANNSDSVIFAAPYGQLHLNNNANINAADTNQIDLDNGSTVIFNPYLSNFTIPGGSGGTKVEPEHDTWQEL